MKVYFLGGGLDTLTVNGDLNGVSENSYYSSSVYPGSVAVDDSTSLQATLLDPDTSLPATVSTGSVWAHIQFKDSRYNLISNGALMTLNDGNGTPVVRLVRVSNGHTMKLQYFAAGVWIDVGASVPTTYDFMTQVDIELKIDATLGRIAWYYGKVLIGETNELDTSSYAVKFIELFSASTQFGNDTNPARYGAIAITDSNTLDCRVSCRHVAANGTEAQWLGDYTGIDEYPTDDSDGIIATADGQISTFSAPDFEPLKLGDEIKATTIACRARNDGDTPDFNLYPLLRIAGVDDLGDEIVLNTGYTGYMRIFKDNPATASPWGTDMAALNSVEIGVKAQVVA